MFPNSLGIALSSDNERGARVGGATKRKIDFIEILGVGGEREIVRDPTSLPLSRASTAMDWHPSPFSL
jgi:hypothetical protein